MLDMKASTGLPSLVALPGGPSLVVTGAACVPTVSVQKSPDVRVCFFVVCRSPNDSQGAEEAAKSVLPSAMRRTKSQYVRSDRDLEAVGVEMQSGEDLCIELPFGLEVSAPGRRSSLIEVPRGAVALELTLSIVMFEDVTKRYDAGYAEMVTLGGFDRGLEPLIPSANSDPDRTDSAFGKRQSSTTANQRASDGWRLA